MPEQPAASGAAPPLKWLARDKSEQNRAALDPWTLVHFASGLAAGLVKMPLGWAFGLAVVYEGVEQVLERSPVGQDLLETSGPETLPNVVVDLVVFAVGHELGRRWNRTGDGRSDRPAG